MVDEKQKSIEADPQLCLDCSQPFITQDISPYGVLALCPPCFRRLAQERLMYHHALRFEADQFIRRFIELLNSTAAPILGNHSAEGVKGFVDNTTCPHGVPVTMCWIHRKAYYKPYKMPDRLPEGSFDGDTIERDDSEGAIISDNSL